MVYGSPPFYNRDHEKMFNDILNKQISFDNAKVDASAEVKDLISKLLIKIPEKRLGSFNEYEIKSHPWFKSINFDKIYRKEVSVMLL
jgi:serine/threonine protein kinase